MYPLTVGWCVSKEAPIELMSHLTQTVSDSEDLLCYPLIINRVQDVIKSWWRARVLNRYNYTRCILMTYNSVLIYIKNYETTDSSISFIWVPIFVLFLRSVKLLQPLPENERQSILISAPQTGTYCLVHVVCVFMKDLVCKILWHLTTGVCPTWSHTIIFSQLWYNLCY